MKNTKPMPATRKTNSTQPRTIGDKTRVKDSLEVINTKLLKELDPQGYVDLTNDLLSRSKIEY